MAAPVLAGLDPATRDLAPARFAAQVAAHTGATLTLATVYADADTVDRLAGGQSGEPLPERADEALAEAANQLGADGTSAETLAIGATSAARGLALAAEQLGAGLLVVGSAAGGAAGTVQPGSTGERLLIGTACAVALVPAGWEPPPTLGTVGVGFLDSAEGRPALAGAHTLARRAAGELRVLAVVAPSRWMGEADAATTDLRRRAEQAAGEAVADLLGVRVNVDVATGDPAARLLELSAEVDVLVCGARGYGAQPATLLGGVSGRVARAAAAPTIVVARGAPVDLAALVDDGAAPAAS